MGVPPPVDVQLNIRGAVPKGVPIQACMRIPFGTLPCSGSMISEDAHFCVTIMNRPARTVGPAGSRGWQDYNNIYQCCTLVCGVYRYYYNPPPPLPPCADGGGAEKDGAADHHLPPKSKLSEP